MKKRILFILFALCINYIFSQDLLNKNTFISDEEIKRIDNGEIISRMYVKIDPLNESTDKNINIVRTKYNNENFNDYEIITDEKGLIPYELNNDSKIKFYNLLCGYSLLKGMKYYSRRDAKVLKLVDDCYRVESLSGKKHPDIVYNEIKPKVVNMFLQKDNKFGKLTYRSELYNEGNNFVLINVNLEPITKLLFTINDKEEFKIYSFFIYDEAKKGFYYYSFIVLRVKVEMVLKQGLFGPTAFSNRLRAATVHLTGLIGLNWTDKLNAWKGIYDDYKKK